MKFLLIAATEAEIAPLIKHIQEANNSVNDRVFNMGGINVKVLITGVGILSTAYKLSKELNSNKYDLVIQAGIAGSFNKAINIGDVVFVVSEQYGDLGTEDGELFLDVFDLGLSEPNDNPFINNVLSNNLDRKRYNISLPAVKALTVNKTTGSKATAELLNKKYNCDLESMEGAALHYVCLSEKVAFAQIRAVSNYIERRNRESWDIRRAIAALNDWLKAYLIP